jgi:hypothetical protein
MKEQTVIPDGYALTEHYEALRRDVTETSGRGHHIRGLALLMHKGMVAWMKGLRQHPVQVTTAAPRATELCLPLGLASHLVTILATMAFATVLEEDSHDSRDPLKSASAASEAQRIFVRPTIDAAASI